MIAICISLSVFALALIVINMICLNLLSKWRNAYVNLVEHAKNLKADNIKLQHDVYRLTYIVPETENKKDRKKNEKN